MSSDTEDQVCEEKDFISVVYSSLKPRMINVSRQVTRFIMQIVCPYYAGDRDSGLC